MCMAMYLPWPMEYSNGQTYDKAFFNIRNPRLSKPCDLSTTCLSVSCARYRDSGSHVECVIGPWQDVPTQIIILRMPSQRISYHQSSLIRLMA